MTIKKLRQDEVLNLLNTKLGVPIKYGTLRNYEKQKLISPPARGSGYGGKWSEYDTVAVAEAATAWRLIHGKYRDSSVNEIFGGAPPAINTNAVALARAVFLERANKTGIINKDYFNRLDKEDWQELQRKDAMLLNDRLGYWYIIRFVAYIWRYEFSEALRWMK
jgi:hypothetical protein